MGDAEQGVSDLDRKFTLQEYLDELQQPIDPPDPRNPNDPRYYKKYVHNMPPLEAYFIIPARKDAVATTDKTQNDRRVYFGWNNITEYEQNGINALKRSVAEKNLQVPAAFGDRDWLKWVQASFYNIEKATEKIQAHFAWLSSIPPEPRLNERTLYLLQSGCFYIFGRDKFYRPAFVMDGRIMADIAKKNPEMITAEVFNDMFVFLFNYLKKVILLPGQIEQWVTIMDLNNMSATSIPRKQILAFGNLC